MFVAYVVVLVPSIVVDILYIIASVIRGHIDFFNEMPTWHSIIVRLAVEYWKYNLHQRNRRLWAGRLVEQVRCVDAPFLCEYAHQW